MEPNNASISIGNIEDWYIGNQMLHRFFENLLEKNPRTLHRVAVKDADRRDTQITFDELNKKSNRLARCLVDRIGKNRKGVHNGLPP